MTKEETGSPSVYLGAVGALAPTAFECVGDSTHGFCKLFSHFHQFPHYAEESVTNLVIP